jgi:alpha-beta hydrolase superfamily lysophospholipase
MPVRRRRLRWFGSAILLVAALGFGASWYVGSESEAPAPRHIGAPPADLPVEAVAIPSGSGSRLAGWFIPGGAHKGAILLLHGIRANRLEMLGRARFFHGLGFAVLLFDFQAHGESPGEHMTFGYLESKDARAAFDFLRSKTPGEKIGIDGLSLGGASALLADPPLEADAMVLEAVFASFDTAVGNRIVVWLGPFGRYVVPLLTPLLTWQVEPRLGFDPALLAPAARIGAVHAPVLLIAGDADRLAVLDEAKLLYANANAPKELWIIQGARHQDFHRYARAEFERRVGDFFKARLRN